MRMGFHLTPFWSPASRGATQLIDEAVQVVGAASRLGFAWVSPPHHWLGQDCVESIVRGREMGLDGIGFTMYSLPRDVSERIDYLHMVSEQILKPAGATLAP